VIIDEIETHLHLRLQEQILPFLTELMPRLQFLVATHSPAVISSIPNAVVYDLGTCEQVLSEELRGIRYGTLMTEHFGIESDMDVDSTEKLERAQELLRKQPRTEEEDRELSRLATELSGRSSTLALELWEAKEQSEARGD
jgi:predicted ATP-binding protein involved in virulence